MGRGHGKYMRPEDWSHDGFGIVAQRDDSGQWDTVVCWPPWWAWTHYIGMAVHISQRHT